MNDSKHRFDLKHQKNSMNDCDKLFETLLHLIFPSHRYPILHEKLSRFKWKKSKYHEESFRQHCVEVALWMDMICLEKNVLQEKWHGYSYAFLVGFFHDFGKPFVLRVCKNGYEAFTGHAQVGARLFSLRFENEIPEPFFLTMARAIDCHMCCLRNDGMDSIHTLRANAVMNLYLSSHDILPVLKCLYRADGRGKIPAVTEENTSHLPKSTIPYLKKPRVAIFITGPSGSGKTTLAKKLLPLLADYAAVEHLERDRVLMQFAEQDESYSACRQRVYSDINLKKEFQDRWTNLLNTAEADILLIDTVQNYYHMEAARFFHFFRIGLYCVPMNFVDSSLHGKSPEIEFPPQKWLGYNTVLTESREKASQLDVATGEWRVIPELVKHYFEQHVDPLNRQPTLATLWKRYDGEDEITAQFNPYSITFVKQYEFSNTEIIRASYLGSTDVTYGPTRFYRGEYLLKTGRNVSMLRSGLPTFSRNFDTTLRTNYDKIIATPKYDGSLVNVLYVPKRYSYFRSLEEHFPETYFDEYDGLLFVGSKQTLVMDETLRKCFDKAMKMEFKDFIRQYAHYFKNERITLHFETMGQASDSLTVYYPDNFCKFLGCTTFTDSDRTFALPKQTDVHAVEQYEFALLETCQVFIREQHDKLLEGDLSCEPEGFVLYVFDEGVLKDVVKQKFEEYYAARKPKLHAEKFEKIWNEPLLMNRFQKCRRVENVENKVQVVVDKLERKLKEIVHGDRKTFALYLKENKETFNDLESELNEILKDLKLPHLKLYNIMFNQFPNVKEMLETIRLKMHTSHPNCKRT